MRWKPFHLRLRLAQPMAVGPGWRLGFVMLTRLCVPPRTLWGAFTDALARWLMTASPSQRFIVLTGNRMSAQFAEVGFWVAKNVRFLPGLFCNWEDGQNGRRMERLLPWYRFGEGPGVKHWTRSAGWQEKAPNDIQRRYVAGHGATALNYETASAEEGMLHETERIMPRVKIENGLIGHVWLELFLFINELEVPHLSHWVQENALNFLRIGRDVGVGDGVFDGLEWIALEDMESVNEAFQLTPQQTCWRFEGVDAPEIHLYPACNDGAGIDQDGHFIRPPGPLLIDVGCDNCDGYWGELRHHIVREHSVENDLLQGFGQKIGYAGDRAQWMLEFGGALAASRCGETALKLEKEGFSVVLPKRDKMVG